MENFPVPDHLVSENIPNEASSPNEANGVAKLQISTGGEANSKNQTNMNYQKDEDEDEDDDEYGDKDEDEDDDEDDEQQLPLSAKCNTNDTGSSSSEEMSSGFLYDKCYVEEENGYASISLGSWPVMKAGKFQWCVKFYAEDEAQNYGCAVGITTFAEANYEWADSDGNFMGKDMPGCSFGHDGMIWCAGQCKTTAQCFGDGDMVMLILDLTISPSPNALNGALYASVNGRRPILLATNLIPYAQANEGFVPAAVVFGGTVIHSEFMEV